MTRVIARITLVAVLAIAAAWTWTAVWHPLAMMREVGLSGWRPESGRQCDDPPGFPWRHCHGRPTPSASSTDIDERLSLDRRTRRITYLERSWRVADSDGLMQQEDSISTALVRRGGKRIPCPLPSSTPDNGLRVAAWRFREQDVRMLTSRLGRAEKRRQEWRVQISGFPVDYSGCGEELHTLRLLTGTEMWAALQQWLAEHIW